MDDRIHIKKLHATKVLKVQMSQSKIPDNLSVPIQPVQHLVATF
jgi:hypothetical protein